MNINLDDIETKGYLDITPDSKLNLVKEINELKRKKKAIILGHFYQKPEIQDISDIIGDSLLLAQKAAESEAEIIVLAGVHFMAETAKILSPTKKILIPDLNAGCSLADSCPADDFAEFIKQHPDHTVISYVNTTAAIKTLTDITCTSTNARQIVESLPKDEKIIFAPDKNLGNYINSVTGRNMLLWDGACHVHQEFSLEKLIELKENNPDAKVLAHPECHQSLLLIADHIGSTSSLLNFSVNDDSAKYIVATESGILHQMQKASPLKTFIPAPPEDSTCACNDCKYMKLHDLRKLYNCLKYELPEVTLPDETIIKAYKSIKRMLDISKELGL